MALLTDVLNGAGPSLGTITHYEQDANQSTTHIYGLVELTGELEKNMQTPYAEAGTEPPFLEITNLYDCQGGLVGKQRIEKLTFTLVSTVSGGWFPR